VVVSILKQDNVVVLVVVVLVLVLVVLLRFHKEAMEALVTQPVTAEAAVEPVLLDKYLLVDRRLGLAVMV
jgi:hypothetical protein